MCEIDLLSHAQHSIYFCFCNRVVCMFHLRPEISVTQSITYVNRKINFLIEKKINFLCTSSNKSIVYVHVVEYCY